MTKNFLLTKEIHKTFFDSGFDVPVAVRDVLSLSLSGGRLHHGEKRTIKIFVAGEPFDATLTSINFNREKYPTHKDIWQVVCSKNSLVAKKIREVFTTRKIFTLCASDMMDNAASNLLVVCPNHHRIIHAAEPTFDRERKIFRYPNGLEEVLRLNAHL